MHSPVANDTAQHGTAQLFRVQTHLQGVQHGKRCGATKPPHPSSIIMPFLRCQSHEARARARVRCDVAGDTCVP